MTSTRKKSRKTATRNGGGVKNGIQRAASEELVLKVSSGDVKMVIREKETMNTARVGSERKNEVKTKSVEEMDRKLGKEYIIITVLTGYGAAEPEAGPEIKFLKSATKALFSTNSKTSISLRLALHALNR